MISLKWWFRTASNTASESDKSLAKNPRMKYDRESNIGGNSGEQIFVIKSRR